MKPARRRWMAAACGSLALLSARAQEGDSPDLDFLEYLGAWQESDAEWLAVAEWEGDEKPGAGGPASSPTDEEDADDAQ